MLVTIVVQKCDDSAQLGPLLDALTGIEVELVEHPPKEGVYLEFSESGLTLWDEVMVKDGERGVHFDFIKQLNYHAQKRYSLRKEPLARAIGLKEIRKKLVLDCTCGTGGDALLLLSFGTRVVAYERNPFIFALLWDAHRRLQRDSSLGGMVERFLLYWGDPRHGVQVDPAVIYLDPMYGEKKKSALPRKEMRIFQRLLSSESDDSKELLQWALAKAMERVVVKRSRSLPPLIDSPKWTAQYTGTTTRYDMYRV